MTRPPLTIEALKLVQATCAKIDDDTIYNFNRKALLPIVTQCEQLASAHIRLLEAAQGVERMSDERLEEVKGFIYKYTGNVNVHILYSETVRARARELIVEAECARLREEVEAYERVMRRNWGESGLSYENYRNKELAHE